MCKRNTRYDVSTGTLKNIRSGPRTLNGSIPQGSVTGCLLFLVYVNNLPDILEEHCTLFADDVTILFKFKNNIDCSTEIEKTIQKVENWLNEHNLEINYTKTKVMEFHSYQMRPYQLDLNNNKIERVQTFNLLGLNIDSNMNWKQHIQITKTKLSHFTYALYNLKKCTDFKTALTAYYASAEACLRYGIILWGTSTDAHDLFLIQKKCIRILAGIQCPQSCKHYFKKFGILTLPSLYILEMAIFVRKNPHLFLKNEQVHNFNLRSKGDLLPPCSRLRKFGTRPNSAAVKIYNKLPQTIKNEIKFKIFKNKLKLTLKNKCYYSLEEYYLDKSF